MSSLIPLSSNIEFELLVYSALKYHKLSTDGSFKKTGGNGEDRIRTYDPLARITVFETAAFDHSANSP